MPKLGPSPWDKKWKSKVCSWFDARKRLIFPLQDLAINRVALVLPCKYLIVSETSVPWPISIPISNFHISPISHVYIPFGFPISPYDPMAPAFMDDGRYCHAFAQEGANGFLELQRGPGRRDLNLGHLPKKIGWSMESPWFITVDDADDKWWWWWWWWWW